MSPKTKLKLTYLILGIAYFAGGIERGVSIPRGWLHWHEDDGTPEHMAALVVAAYGVATFFVAPFVGRWVDRPGRAKSVIVVGTLFHMLAAALEYFLVEKWTNTIARFLSGIGGGMDVAVLSETSRYTSHSSRTSAMALLVGARLLGCVIVPGLDAVLWTKVLKNIHGELPGRKIAASGASLLVLWGVVLLLTVIFYTELCRLRPVPQYSSPQREPIHRKHSSQHSHPNHAGTAADSCDILSNNSTNILSSQGVSIPVSLASSYTSEQACSGHLARSSEMIEEAEMYINRMAEQLFSGSIAKPFQIKETDRTCEQPVLCDQPVLSEQSDSTNCQMSTSFNASQEREGMRRSDAEEGGVGGRGASEVIREEEGEVTQSSSGSFDQSAYVQRQSILPRALQGLPQSIFDSLYEEFIRDDIVALLTILMSGTFSHLCFQMLVTAVAQRYLGSEDLDMIAIFFVAVVLLEMVCMLVWWFNPQKRAVHVLVAAGFILIIGNIVCMVTFSRMSKDEEGFEERVFQIAVSIAVFVIGVPLLLISATSIYTQRSRKQHHGLRQGVYHSVLSLSAILAPLWMGGTFTQPYLHHAVIISLLLFSLILVFYSFKKLTLLCHSSRSKTAQQNCARSRRSAAWHPSEQQPLLS